MIRLACLVLAAGGSRRFGGCKQLAKVNGNPLVLHCLDALKPHFQSDLFLLLGAESEKIKSLVQNNVQVIENENWSDGIGSSIACGINQIEKMDTYDGVMVALADQPRLTGSDYNKLLDQFDGSRIVAARYAGTIGVPAIFPAELFGHLKQLKGDKGAKSLLACHNDRVLSVQLPRAECDIDTPADLLGL